MCSGVVVAGHQRQTPLKLRCQTIAKVQELCIENGWAMPDHLVIQNDNTTAQAKHDETLVFLTLQVLRQRFQTATLDFLMPEHTHEDVDQLFGVVTAWMLQLLCFNSPADVLEHLHSQLQTKLVDQAAVACCEHLAAAHDFKGWLEPWGLHFCDALCNQGGVVTPHLSMFKPQAVAGAHRNDKVSQLPLQMLCAASRPICMMCICSKSLCKPTVQAKQIS
jgi:hypothetical protein